MRFRVSKNRSKTHKHFEQELYLKRNRFCGFIFLNSRNQNRTDKPYSCTSPTRLTSLKNKHNIVVKNLFIFIFIVREH